MEDKPLALVISEVKLGFVSYSINLVSAFSVFVNDIKDVLFHTDHLERSDLI